jgi:hypothetical protein
MKNKKIMPRTTTKTKEKQEKEKISVGLDAQANQTTTGTSNLVKQISSWRTDIGVKSTLHLFGRGIMTLSKVHDEEIKIISTKETQFDQEIKEDVS